MFIFIDLLSYSPCLASGSGSDEEEEDDDEEESSSQSEGEEEEEESVSGSGRSEQSAGKSVKDRSTTVTHVAASSPDSQHDGFNSVASSLSEDVSEDEQSVEDFEEERENGNHIPAGGSTCHL